MSDTAASPSAARLSVMIGLLLVTLCSWPRYQLGGYDTHSGLLAMVAAGLAVVIIAYWRRMTKKQRELLPARLKWLVVAFVAGGLIMALWHYGLASARTEWATVLSHGATAGLLLHAISTGWRARR
ncbi:hypothetical protein C8E00_101650 [Chromohalobacter marismortui]|uniref:Transmembrane protein n=1 Tax=Chromohalobacter marismortui TaxID=42055 RepID=A0A4R7NVN5_9GAMM|nr:MULTISPECIES: hypothetical protein [Chromohalobacter]MCI0511229.1 hypothetical protein [Chromohalobacter sp.]MCI0593914.1 hypothetical protein [Chromohalobacter sp.]TDU25254.1 hypothetical protein C8E00_101650 [Chromohalobacter marismortui]